MSEKHPVIAVTGSSGAGTTTVKNAFEHIFRREDIKPLVVEGDSFHRYDRASMKKALEEFAKKGKNLSHFGPDANHFDLLAETFATYGRTGKCKRRYYIHSDAEAVEHNARLNASYKAGEFTPWETISDKTDLLFYEGLHGAVVTETVDVARYADLLVGVVPIINLEWIQKLIRDKAARGYSTEAVVDTILRRMPDYINYITPQFSRTHVNFQRVPTVDTSNPFIAEDIPTADESFVVIRFANPKGIDFPYLLAMVHDSFMTRPNVITVPGGKMELAMQLIFTPMILRLIENKKRGAIL